MIALTRLPSGRRASTIGDDSSMRRPTSATILLMIRRRCESSVKRTVVSYSRPWRSTQTSYGPLTMISVTLSSASSRSSGPWPRMSSVSSAARRSRSSRERPDSACEVGLDLRRSPARGVATGSAAGVEELRPELGDHRQVDAVLELGERIRAGASPRAAGRASRVARAVPSLPLPRAAPPASRRCRARGPSAARYMLGQRPGTPWPASERGLAQHDRSPWFTDRGMSRSLGISTSGVAADDRRARRHR